MGYNPEAFVRSILRVFMTEVYTNIPAIVLDYNALKQTCTCVVAVETPLFGDNNLPPPILEDVPVQFPAGGGKLTGWFVGGPLNPGDGVMINCCHYGIEEWLNGKTTELGSSKIPVYHDIGESFAVPGTFTYESPTCPLLLRGVFNISQGLNYITMGLLGINIQSPVSVNIRSGATTVVVTPLGVTITGPVLNVIAPAMTLTGAVTIVGALTATSITAPIITSGTTVLATHIHGNGNNGANTFVPI